MPIYIAYPGTGKVSPSAEPSYITGAEVAALYGLGADEYEVGIEEDQRGTSFDVDHIHLLPRPDGLYRNIKTELGDNGTPYHWDKMVNPEKWRKDNEDREIKRYSS